MLERGVLDLEDSARHESEHRRLVRVRARARVRVPVRVRVRVKVRASCCGALGEERRSWSSQYSSASSIVSKRSAAGAP